MIGDIPERILTKELSLDDAAKRILADVYGNMGMG